MKIGIFWYHDNTILGFARTLDESEERGEFLDSPVNHVHYWRVIQGAHPALRHTEYFTLPRGRVLYEKARRRGIVYMDKLLFDATIKKQVRAFFDLPAKGTKFERDAHYTTDEDDLRALFGR